MEIRNFKKDDEYYTPRYAVIPLLKYLKPNSIIWCPFDTENSQYVKVFNEFNHTVVYSHIDEGDDFFNTICNCDYIISNPPYSLKYEVLLRLYELNKPFAMLLGSHGIFEAKRFKLFSQNNFELMVLDKRIVFKKGGAPPFQNWYICNGMLPEKIVFEEINKKG
ncbi:MAG: sugar-phospahte nucleotidyltransferase [Spirochaetes bacterium]|nr:sugar-phospahte nucleotidyltransferase [Spirochaetota bacterium]